MTINIYKNYLNLKGKEYEKDYRIAFACFFAYL